MHPDARSIQGRGTGTGRRGAGTAGGTTTASRSRAKGGAGGAGKELQPHEGACLAAAQRDLGLDLFHALGKILYNKRDVDVAGLEGGAAGPVEAGGGSSLGWGAPTQTQTQTQGGAGAAVTQRWVGGGVGASGRRKSFAAPQLPQLEGGPGGSGRPPWMPSLAWTEQTLEDW